MLRRRLSSFTDRRMFASWKLNIIGYMSTTAIKPGFSHCTRDNVVLSCWTATSPVASSIRGEFRRWRRRRRLVGHLVAMGPILSGVLLHYGADDAADASTGTSLGKSATLSPARRMPLRAFHDDDTPLSPSQYVKLRATAHICVPAHVPARSRRDTVTGMALKQTAAGVNETIPDAVA